MSNKHDLGNFLEQRLAAAKLANLYVKSCNVLSSNKGLSNFAFNRHVGLLGMRSAWDDNGTISSIDNLAEMAVANKLGNCTEKAAIAFMYLYRLKRSYMKPLHWASVGTSHFLVIMGQTHGAYYNRSEKFFAFENRPDTWPTDTVVCDPWRNVVHNCVQWKEYQGGGTNVMAQHTVKS